MMDDLEEDVLQTSFGKSLLEKGNKIAFRKSEQKSIRGGLTGAKPPWWVSKG